MNSETSHPDEPNLTGRIPEPVVPPVIGVPSLPAGPKPFSTWLTIVFAVLAITACLFRNWPYLTEDRIALLSDPKVIALWIIHDGMLLYEGAKRMPTGGKSFLLAAGTDLETTPEDCEEVLRDVIAHLESSGANRVAILELRANLAVLLAETGALNKAAQVLVQLGDSDEASRFIRVFYRVYDTRSATALLPGDNEAANLLVSGWGRWRFAGRLSELTGNHSESEHYDESIKSIGASRMARWVFWNTGIGLAQLAGFASFVFLLISRTRLNSPLPWASSSWSAGEGWGLFVRAVFWGFVAEYALTQIPIFSYLAWLSHCLILGLPAVVLLLFRHWQYGNGSFQRFFGWPEQSAGFVKLLLATFAAFAFGWLAIAWMSYGFDLAGFESDWTEVVDEVLYVWPWYAQVFHLLDAIVWGPCAEEILFRGLLFGALRARFSAWPSALLSALPFGLYHFYGLPGFVAVTTFGVVCAIAREKTGSLLPCIGAHMLTNFLIFGGAVFVRC